MSADAADLDAVDRFRADLAEKIHLQTGVDGDQVVVFPGHIGVVDVGGRIDVQGGVVVHIVIQLLCAHDERDNGRALVEVFTFVGDHSGLGQIGHAVGDQLRVNAQIVFIHQA